MKINKSWKYFVFFLGFLAPLTITYILPPPPPFSPTLRRATYLQSYETSYFSSLRSYERVIQETIDGGYIPIIIFGDSSMRGTGASGERVWTIQLENKLRKHNPNIRIVNFAQNAGDLVGPFLYYHLQKKFPNAYYIVQWNCPATIGVRHFFHYWLTSEIAIKDGYKNFAVKRSFELVRVMPSDFSGYLKKGGFTEAYSFLFASLNTVFNYLDVGNWARYEWFGRLLANDKRKIILEPLKNAPESDIDVFAFKKRDEQHENTMKEIFFGIQNARLAYTKTPFIERKDYFDSMFPPSLRSHLMILTVDLNPHYLLTASADNAKEWADAWDGIRSDMAKISDIQWVSLTAFKGEMEVNDYLDLGHLTPAGQEKLAAAVTAKITSPKGWFPLAEVIQK